MLVNRPLLKFTAKVLLLVMTYELVYPVSTFALTSGPSQPEVQSFEPVGTTDMVDLFTGDFVYNIPLLDIEGYPVNIAYHSGVNMEQEASWVGLGWNINPGVINRTVRGMPDDFNGEVIEKTLSIKEERNFRIGASVGAEIAGVGDPLIGLSLDASINLNVSNYRGVSADFGLAAGVNVMGFASAGVNLGVSSQNGADIDYNLGLRFNSSMIVSSDVSGGIGASYGHGYNSRTAAKSKNFGITTNVNIAGRNYNGPSYRSTVPVGVNNVIPVVTNSSKMRMFRGQLKFGTELFGTFWHFGVQAMVSGLQYDTDGSAKGYGFIYSQNADDKSIHDFTRDKDGMFNETMSFLPPANMTYDIYSVAGQGTGGSFRPFRNDVGSVFDPVTSSKASEHGGILEAGVGNTFEIGSDYTASQTVMNSGPWEKYKRPFQGKKLGTLYESVYFKQAGEATELHPGYMGMIGGTEALSGGATGNLPLYKPGSEDKRDPRANLIYYLTAAEASKYGVASSQELYSYNSTDGFASGPDVSKTSISRTSGGRKAHHVSEIVQVQTDGRKYVFGIPAMNTEQEEYSFAVTSADEPSGIITFSSGDNSSGNNKGRDNYFSKTSTPAFAHSYLLTSVLSTDYVDVTGDGPTDDDFGSYTKFNYTRKNEAYQWRAPYGTNKAQHNPGFKSDKMDDKGSYLTGKREQWILHSVESKNFVAEFYTSERSDGKGVGSGDHSYKLDSIKLFSKHDRFLNTTSAVPVKTVMFKYDYSLCPGVPNSTASGKLTLKRIYVRYGDSDKSMISPYEFEYDNNFNFSYNAANRDRWGAYKPNDNNLPNHDFPFVKQDDPNLDDYATAWSLTKIKLPSGGSINIDYEADDYAYVQNEKAMEMFIIQGIGNSPLYGTGNQLYFSKDNPNLYFYFKRRKADERPGFTLEQNYLEKQEIVYYNVATQLGTNDFEPIKGYAEIDEVGYCNNDPDSDYGYVKVKPVIPKGGGATVHPSTHMAINFGRYYLPQVMFPGNDDDLSNVENVLAGLKYAFNELISITKNPIKRMVNEGKAKEVQLEKSFLRLHSVGFKKKGGGLRVKQLTFQDNWNDLAGGNTASGVYGKKYDYTIDMGYGKISSGVASYEPMIGGDENPFRKPIEYITQSGTKFPPSDPIGLYQEEPIGESLYPGPVVGYSKVTVTSIHKETAISAQGVDIHEFYTAKEAPVQVKYTSIDKKEEATYKFKEQKRSLEGKQGYSLIFNDMHGKPRRTEKRIFKPSTGVSELVSYQHYKYFPLGSAVPVMEYDKTAGKMRRTSRVVGQEADITIDTRHKSEKTDSETWYANLNFFMIGPIPCPIPFGYPAEFFFENEFMSVTATKVIQRYGVIREVESFNEGALTVLRNEAFDPLTGQAVITSVNNEYDDTEYSVNYPAYWGYKSMGASYRNTLYEESFNSVQVTDYEGLLPVDSTAGNYNVGDELLITYNHGGQTKTNNVWVMGFKREDTTLNWPYCPCPVALNDTIPPHCVLFDTTINFSSTGPLLAVIEPRFKYHADWPSSGNLSNVHIKVIRSGQKNQLNESIQSYTTMEQPLDNNQLLKDRLTKVINISAREYSDTMTAILPRYDSINNPGGWDSLNVYVNGTKQIKRLSKEYAYQKNRDYSGNTVRKAGLFNSTSLWSGTGFIPYNNLDTLLQCCPCADSQFLSYKYHITGTYYGPNSELTSSYMSPDPSLDKSWVTARTVTKWSPWGFELENKDAIGNYTTAVYGYNNQLPVVVAQNARQHSVFAESFEDYRTTFLLSRLVQINVSPFEPLFGHAAIGGSPYGVYNLTGSGGFVIASAASHSGLYSLSTSGSASVTLNVANEPDTTGQPRFLKHILKSGQQYHVSYWYRPKTISGIPNAYTPPTGFLNKSGIIEGWQQAEMVFTAPSLGSTYNLVLPANAYVDDIRIMPMVANMKSFVYNPVNQRLVATLDENNFATFYEYDPEGNLIRTKKETEKGIVTIMESRSANPKK